jgi:5-methylcytosine-specific restriction enzyme subunit McrC
MLLKTNRTDITVSFQNRTDFWETRTIRPDIVLKHKKDNETLTYVIDTKWKLLDTTNPKPSDDDLKQMFSYNLYWNAKRSMLLYPNSNAINESFGRFWKGADSPKNNLCKVGFIHVLNDQNQLDFEIGNKILEKIIE